MYMRYHAYLTDHQGNVRVVVDENATTKQINHYYPYGGLMAESTNGSVQRYKYNGKELDRMHGLDWYDYGAHYSDAAIGRWHSIDPLCEKYYDVSPYAYCLDNPINDIKPLDDKNPHSLYNTEDDYRVITGSEQKTAEALGEIKTGEVTRMGHYGKPIETISPISNTPINKIEEFEIIGKQKQ